MRRNLGTCNTKLMTFYLSHCWIRPKGQFYQPVKVYRKVDFAGVTVDLRLDISQGRVTLLGTATKRAK
jgi:hypothetical protein